MPVEIPERRPPHGDGGVLARVVDDDDVPNPEIGGEGASALIRLGGPGFDGDGHHSGLDGLLEQSGDLEPAEVEVVGDLDFRAPLHVVGARELGE